MPGKARREESEARGASGELQESLRRASGEPRRGPREVQERPGEARRGQKKTGETRGALGLWAGALNEFGSVVSNCGGSEVWRVLVLKFRSGSSGIQVCGSEAWLLVVLKSGFLWF